MTSGRILLMREMVHKYAGFSGLKITKRSEIDSERRGGEGLVFRVMLIRTP